jgi:hypothetical protein
MSSDALTEEERKSICAIRKKIDAVCEGHDRAEVLTAIGIHIGIAEETRHEPSVTRALRLVIETASTIFWANRGRVPLHERQD